MSSRKGSELIPVYIDGTELPGLDVEINYFRSNDAEKIATMIVERIRFSEKTSTSSTEDESGNATVTKSIHIIGDHATVADTITNYGTTKVITNA